MLKQWTIPGTGTSVHNSERSHLEFTLQSSAVGSGFRGHRKGVDYCVEYGEPSAASNPVYGYYVADVLSGQTGASTVRAEPEQSGSSDQSGNL